MERGIVEENSMRLFVMFAQPFPMVPYDDD